MNKKVFLGNCPVFKVFLIVCIVTSTLSISSKINAAMLSIKGDNINLRSGPGIKYEVKWEYGSGFPVHVVKKQGSWVKIKDFENDTGWVHSSLLENKPQMIVRANRNVERKINIRSGAGTKSKVVGQAYYGVVFKTLDRKSDWVKVKHDTGLTGWIHSSLLWGY